VSLPRRLFGEREELKEELDAEGDLLERERE
jgi:hypothetical protein